MLNANSRAGTGEESSTLCEEHILNPNPALNHTWTDAESP